MKSTRRTRRLARQVFRLCLIDGRLNEDRARRVARRIAGSRRRGGLAVLAGLQRLVRLDTTRHTALIESATRLDDDLRQSIQKDLTRMYGGGLHTSFSENPGLIGGVRIKVGSDVYDGSVQHRLDTLETSL